MVAWSKLLAQENFEDVAACLDAYSLHRGMLSTRAIRNATVLSSNRLAVRSFDMVYIENRGENRYATLVNGVDHLGNYHNHAYTTYHDYTGMQRHLEELVSSVGVRCGNNTFQMRGGNVRTFGLKFMRLHDSNLIDFAASTAHTRIRTIVLRKCDFRLVSIGGILGFVQNTQGLQGLKLLACDIPHGFVTDAFVDGIRGINLGVLDIGTAPVTGAALTHPVSIACLMRFVFDVRPAPCEINLTIIGVRHNNVLFLTLADHNLTTLVDKEINITFGNVPMWTQDTHFLPPCPACSTRSVTYIPLAERMVNGKLFGAHVAFHTDDNLMCYHRRQL